jgi:addiction module RelE/StbE family toxin
MKIVYEKNFIKDFEKAPLKIQKAFIDRLELFLRDKRDPILHDHSLKGTLKNYRSINITGDWRAIYREFPQEVVFFIILATHSELY